MRRVLFAVAVCCGIAGGSARADVSYQYVAGQSSYTVSQNATISVPIYLQETITPGMTTSTDYNQSIINLDGGLVGAGVFVNSTGGAGNATISSVAANVGAGANKTTANFDTNENTKNNANQAAILVGNTGSQNTFGNTAPGVVSSTTTYQVLIGTLTINGSAQGTTTYSLSTYAKTPTSLGGNGADGQTVTAGTNFGVPVQLDLTNNPTFGGPPPSYIGTEDPANTVSAAFTVTVSAVPEPSSMLLCGLMVPAVGFGAWVRWRKRLVTAA